MMQVQLRNIVESIDVLSKLAQKPMKAKLAYNVGRMLKQVENEMNSFNTTRMDLIKKYGEKDENGELIVYDDNNYRVSQESVQEFNDEFNELIASTIELNANKINFEDLEELDFTPQEMVLLEPFIEIEE